MVLPQRTSFNSSFLQFLNQKGWEKTAPVEEPKFFLDQQQKTKLFKEQGIATPPTFLTPKAPPLNLPTPSLNATPTLPIVGPKTLPTNVTPKFARVPKPVKVKQEPKEEPVEEKVEVDENEEDLSEYEKIRLANIAQRKKKFEELKLSDLTKSVGFNPPPKKRRIHTTPTQDPPIPQFTQTLRTRSQVLQQGMASPSLRQNPRAYQASVSTQNVHPQMSQNSEPVPKQIPGFTPIQVQQSPSSVSKPIIGQVPTQMTTNIPYYNTQRPISQFQNTQPLPKNVPIPNANFQGVAKTSSNGTVAGSTANQQIQGFKKVQVPINATPTPQKPVNPYQKFDRVPKPIVTTQNCIPMSTKSLSEELQELEAQKIQKSEANKISPHMVQQNGTRNPQTIKPGIIRPGTQKFPPQGFRNPIGVLQSSRPTNLNSQGMMKRPENQKAMLHARNLALAGMKKPQNSVPSNVRRPDPQRSSIQNFQNQRYPKIPQTQMGAPKCTQNLRNQYPNLAISRSRNI